MWVRHASSTTKHHVPYQPEFCVASDQEPLETAEGLLAADARVESVRRDQTRLWLRGPLHDVLRIKPKRLQDTWGVATDLRKATKTKGFLFFDVDHSQESRWMHSRGLWSLCRLSVSSGEGQEEAKSGWTEGNTHFRLAEGESRWTYDYPDPGLRTIFLEVKATQLGPVQELSDPLESIRLGDEIISCAKPGNKEHEADTLRELGRWLHRNDPDVILTRHGDRFDIPYLLRRIQELGLRERVWLGRDPDPMPDKPDQAGKSIHTYGRWLYKTHAYYLRGRWHIDLSKKILDAEEYRKDVHGIVYLARVANRRAQDINRNGAGFALQQMQIDLATDWGVALPWKRNLAEDWKDAATLCAVDRGGQIIVPQAGIYEDVCAVDFSGFYPSLVVAHNLSGDTVNCTCCPDGEMVPELGYHVCVKERNGYGHQALVLKRLEEHRRRAKAVLRLEKSGLARDGNEVDKARAIKSEHKALGVVCFGYFRYRNARFGCAEVHQSIQCYGRQGMTRVRELAQEDGYRMVHALTDCAFLQRKGVTLADARKFTNKVGRDLKVPMDVEGVYKWLVLLPSKTHSTSSSVGVPNRYYGKFEDGELKVRGIEVQRHSTPDFLFNVQQGMLDIFQQADDARGFLERIPLALRVAKAAAARLMRREVAVAELGTMVQARMSVEEYRSNTGAKAALRKLRDAGTERRPGEYIKYVVTRTEGPWEGRTTPVELVGKESPWFGQQADTYNVDAYLRLLARSVETLLAPFGYDEDSLHAWLSGKSKLAYGFAQRTAGPRALTDSESRFVHTAASMGTIS